VVFKYEKGKTTGDEGRDLQILCFLQPFRNQQGSVCLSTAATCINNCEHSPDVLKKAPGLLYPPEDAEPLGLVVAQLLKRCTSCSTGSSHGLLAAGVLARLLVCQTQECKTRRRVKSSWFA